MLLSDGEYEIRLDDVPHLEAVKESGARTDSADIVAIRHGFVPDSMNLALPQTLYRNENQFILSAQAISATADPIFFDGKSQTISSPADGCYLVMEQGPGGGLNLRLCQFRSSIRFAKARNVAALQSRVAQLEKMASSLAATPEAVSTRPSSSKPDKLEPSAFTTQIQLDESDFDSLDDDLEENKFPQFPLGFQSDNDESGRAKIIAQKTPPNIDKSKSKAAFLTGRQSPEANQTTDNIVTPMVGPMKSKPGPKVKAELVKKRQSSETGLSDSRDDATKKALKLNTRASTQSKKRDVKSSALANNDNNSSIDDDDFADLEDELHKVLEFDDEPKSKFNGSAVKFDQDPQPRLNLAFNAKDGKPRSLREMVREESSSEED